MSIEDDLNLGRPLGRLLNAAALLDFMTSEIAEVHSDAAIGARRRDALVAALEASVRAIHDMVEAVEVADRERHAAKENAE